MFGIVVALSCALALAATSDVNYCGAKMCGGKNTHTYCQYLKGASDKCEDYIYSGLSSEEKKSVLDRINSFRTTMAFGRTRSFPPAKNMMKMRWVEELAREAQRWADQCRPPQIVEEHDTCRDLYSVTVGQCVASMVGQTPLRIEQLVDIWYIQSVYYNISVRYYVPPRNGSRYYGDFAQLFWAKSFMVGCGRSRFMAPWKGRLQRVERLVCNVAPRGPQTGHSVWAPGAPASSCPYGSAPAERWRFLCDYKQKQNDIVPPNSSTTLEDNLLLNSILEIEENDTLNYLGSVDEIYLTKLSNATLNSSLPTEALFNSKHRREVNDTTAVFVPQVAAAQEIVQETLITTANTTLQLQTETSTKVTKTIQRKYENELDWIAQPEIYDLEDVDNYNEETEIIKRIEERPKRKKNSHVEYGFVNTTNDNATSKVLLNGKEDAGSSDVSEVTSSVDNYEDDIFKVKSDRQIKAELYLKEHELEPKRQKQKKVRRALTTDSEPDDDDEEEVTTVVYKKKVEGHNPLVAVIKLIPSMADYNFDNYPDERFRKAMAEKAALGTASHVTCDTFISVIVMFRHIFILFRLVL